MSNGPIEAGRKDFFLLVLVKGGRKHHITFLPINYYITSAKYQQFYISS